MGSKETRFTEGLLAAFILYCIGPLTAMGGILILGVGINLLNLKKIKVTNLLPALIIVVILTLIFKAK